MNHSIIVLFRQLLAINDFFFSSAIYRLHFCYLLDLAHLSGLVSFFLLLTTSYLAFLPLHLTPIPHRRSPFNHLFDTLIFSLLLFLLLLSPFNFSSFSTLLPPPSIGLPDDLFEDDFDLVTYPVVPFCPALLPDPPPPLPLAAATTSFDLFSPSCFSTILLLLLLFLLIPFPLLLPLPALLTACYCCFFI